MKRSFLPIILLLFAAVFGIGIVSAAEIFAEKVVGAPGEEKIVEVWLSEAPTGLAGYIMAPILVGDEIATIQFIPSEEFILSDIDEENMTASALDLYDAVYAGSEPILLGTLHISAFRAGESVVYFEIVEITDDMGSPIEITQNGIHVQVLGEKVPVTMVGLNIQP